MRKICIYLHTYIIYCTYVYTSYTHTICERSIERRLVAVSECDECSATARHCSRRGKRTWGYLFPSFSPFYSKDTRINLPAEAIVYKTVLRTREVSMGWSIKTTLSYCLKGVTWVNERERERHKVMFSYKMFCSIILSLSIDIVYSLS